MQVKSNLDEIQNFLSDASNLRGGVASSVVFPESAQHVGEILREANSHQTPVTVSGAGTGTVGGRVPFGGVVMALDKLRQIKQIVKFADGNGCGIIESAVILADYQKAVEAQNLFYPPDPTEWSCQMGGTIATNASGARSFKYGATREFVERLEIVLATGEILNLRRGEFLADKDHKFRVQVGDHQTIISLPTYKMPDTRKHAAGYFVRPKMDLIDLFVGSEGTLGVVTEIETRLLAKPVSILSGVVFFKDKLNLLNFVNEARETSFATREKIRNPSSEIQVGIDARVLEYFDRNALDFVREKFPLVPENMAGAVFFEQEATVESEEKLLESWFELLEKNNAETDDSWFATNENDWRKMREFRHALPVAVNEFIVRHGQRKISTDMAVPDAEFPQMLRFYEETLQKSDLKYVVFGHIGDNHLHVNILPRNDDEAHKAKQIYGRFVARACIVGGTISAEHGIGKLKNHYLEVMFGERYLNEMATVKRALDPAGILNRGVMFDKKFI